MALCEISGAEWVSGRESVERARTSNQSSAFIFFVVPHPSIWKMEESNRKILTLQNSSDAMLFICGRADGLVSGCVAVVRKWDFFRRCCRKSNLLFVPSFGDIFLVPLLLHACKKMRGLGCLTHALAHARFTQPCQHISRHLDINI